MAFITTTAASISSGGTITGDITIEGDLTVEGGGSLSYDEIIQGTQVIDTNSNAISFTIDSESTSTSVFKIDTPTTTTGTILDISTADSLTSGKIAYFESNSTDTTARNLVEIHQEAGAATGAVALHVKQSSLNYAMTINNPTNFNGWGDGLAIASANTHVSSRLIHIESGHATLGSGTTRFTVLGDGNVGIGTSSPAKDLHVAKSGEAQMIIDSHVAGASGSSIRLRHSRNATIGSHTVVNDNDEVGDITFQGSDGNSYEAVASIRGKVDDGSISDGSIGGSLVFKTGSSNGTRLIMSDSSNTFYNQVSIEGSTGRLTIKSTDTSAGDAVLALVADNATADGDFWQIEADGGTTKQLKFQSFANGSAYVPYLILDANSRISLSNNDSSGEASSTFLGYEAGNAIASGAHKNLAIGHQALAQADACDDSIAIGYRALYGTDAGTCGDNIAIGNSAMVANMTHVTRSIGIGSSALGSLAGATTPSDNIGIGYNAGNSMTNCSSNIAIGGSAMGEGGGNAITGGSNTAVGTSAMYQAEGAVANNVAVGANAMFDVTTGSGNVAVGMQAGYNITDNADNVIVGYEAFFTANSGENENVVIGKHAGYYIDNASADENIIIGKGAGQGGSGDLSGCIAIGANALDATGSNDHTGTIGIGHNALGALTSGASNVAVGYQSLDACTTGAQNTAVGESTLSATDDGTSNVAIGNSAMGLGNAGHSNVAVGSQSMVDLTGNYNTALGMQSAFDLTSGVGNVALGALALKLASGGESYNIAIGVDAMTEVIENGNTADSNIAIGAIAMKGGTLGGDFIGNIAIGRYAMDDTDTNAHTGTIAIGYSALTALTSGIENTAIGYNAGLALTTSRSNTILGYSAMHRATTASDYNTAIGAHALNGSFTTADVNFCVAVGYASLQGILTSAASGTTAIGYASLANNTSGTGNTAVGYQTGGSITSGSYSTFIGHNAGLVHSTGGYNTVIGYGAMDDTNAGSNSLGSLENVFIGVDSGGGTWADAASNNNVAIGNYSMDAALNGASDNIAVGKNSLGAITQGDNNVAVGSSSLLALTTGSQNIAVGKNSGDSITDGTYNTFMGYYAGAATTSAVRTVAIGTEAMESGNVTSDAEGTVAIGSKALFKLTSAQGNTAIGQNALSENTTGNYNIAIGHNAMNSQQAGGTQSTSATSHSNTFIGVDAGGGNWADAQSNYNVSIGNASMDANMNGALSNTSIGYASLSAITSGDSNVSIGKDSAVGITTGSNNVVIGDSANCGSGASNQTVIGQGTTGVADNSVTLGNASVTDVYMAQDKGAKIHARNMVLQDTASFQLGLEAYGDGSWAVMDMKSAKGTIASPTAIDEADYILGRIRFLGYEASSFRTGAEIRGYTEGVWDGNTWNSYLSFMTVPNDNTATATEKLRVTGSNVELTSGQLKFPATQNASSDANTLDDYEEGYFTGALTCGSGTATVNGSYDQLAYTKIGRMVHVQGGLVMSAISSPSGTLTINLPFTSGTLTEAADFVTGIASYTGVNALKSASLLGVRINQGANTASLVEFTTTSEDGSDAADNITASTQIYFGFSYMV